MTVLQARNLSINLGGRPVLQDVSLTLARGCLLGLVGPNGAGKTTLVRALTGLVPACAGTVNVRGKTLGALKRRDRARAIAYLPQGQVVHWPLSVERLVALGRLPHLPPLQRPGPADAAIVDIVLAETETVHLRARRISDLSAGERARVLLARALAVDAPFLLADEPVAALDPYHQLHVMELLAGRAARGAGILVVLHDLTLAARFCTRLVLIDSGRIAAEGLPHAVLNPERLRDTYRVEALALPDMPPVILPWTRLPH